jgi:ABC-2 type transport system permease protein
VNVHALPEAGRVRSVVDYYLTMMRTAVVNQFQYRVAQYFYMLGMVAEPIVYLVVWTTIANEAGGEVNGITAGEFAAYYIVWTLVRNMNVVFGAPFWEWRIREGRMSAELLRPLHPLHNDIAWFAGSKFVVVLLWLPIAAGLTIAFEPTIDPSALEIVVFSFSIWGAYLLRTMLQSTLGMLCFWTTRGAAIFDLYMTTELLLSGRLVPLPLMPDWV